MNQATTIDTHDMDSGRTFSKALLAGRIISILLVLFMLFDGIGKLLRIEESVDGTIKLGYPDRLVIVLGVVLIIVTVLYAIPRTAILGAILLTAYLGGATATQVRVESMSFIFPILFGLLVWAGVYLRDCRLRALFSSRSSGRS
ncbi:MAG: DoxX family protein [Thermomicrobiales bacterium]